MRDWLPDGRQESDEWIARNPTRHDENLGSFKINLKTGAWCDFADNDARGNDIVSLYAYLNYDKCFFEASQKKYKNVNGGTQAEAARFILIEYDGSYFPDEKDNFYKEDHTAKKDFWDGYRIVESGIEDPPELDVTWFEDKWGKCENKWYFIKKKKTIFAVARFRLNDKKNDRPFTLWTDGNNTKWRAKSLDKNYPLYNYNDISERMNDPICLCEGQKKPAMLKELIDSEFICTGWYGGAGNSHLTDWEPLRAREVWFPFDADIPGRAALKKIKELSETYNFILHIVYPPLKVKKGWSLDDAIDEGWTKDELLYFLKTPIEEKKAQSYLDDDGTEKYRILGYTGDQIAFYPYGSRIVTKIKASSLNKGSLLTLQDMEEWGEYYKSPDGGTSWGAAINKILRKADELPIFDQSLVRRTGAWTDTNKVVINTGEHLLIDGIKKELYQNESQYVYERGKFLPYGTEKPLSCDDAQKLLDIMKYIQWEDDIFGLLFAGWLLLAPYGGVLRWRPYVWLTGRLGTGKSWILENISRPLTTHWFGILGRGTSSPAGYRQALENSTKCTEVDEMDANNKRDEENIDQTLKIFREGSSGAEYNASTLHGTSDGSGRPWLVQSMALFASISTRLILGSDRSRFTVVTLGKHKKIDIEEKEKLFAELKQKVNILTPLWAKAFHARTYTIIDEVLKCVNIMCDQATDILRNRRDGDQIGTLFAGAWMCSHDISATAGEARIFLEKCNIENIQQETGEKGDEEIVLDEILSARIELYDGDNRTKVPIGSALQYWYAIKDPLNFGDYKKYEFPGAEVDTIKRELDQWGIHPSVYGGNNILGIAINHPGIIKLLKETSWANSYSDLLARLSFCEPGQHGPRMFGSINKRYRKLNANELFDLVPF